MAWWHVALWLVATVLSYALSPRPKTPDPIAPDTLDSMKFPTAKAGREIPVLFGTRWIKSPNVVWYGDLKTTPIKSQGGKK